MNAATVLIADDHPLVRSGLRLVIEATPGLRVVAEAGDGEAALAQLEALEPDVAILDLAMPRMDGLAVLGAIRARGLSTAAIVLTLHADEQTLFDVIDLGAAGYVLKDSAPDCIIEGIAAVVRGGRYLTPSLAPLLLNRRTRQQRLRDQRPGLAALTPTERRILRLIAAGRSSKEIAETLFIHYRTVENHRANMAQKLGLRGPNAVLKFAMEHRGEL